MRVLALAANSALVATHCQSEFVMLLLVYDASRSTKCAHVQRLSLRPYDLEADNGEWHGLGLDTLVRFRMIDGLITIMLRR